MRYVMDGYLMSGDQVVARIDNGILTNADNVRLPFYLQRCNDLDSWLRNRAAPRPRSHSSN